MKRPWLNALTVFAVFLLLFAVTAFPPNPYNEQVRTAFAYLHGSLSIDAPQNFLEHAQVGPWSYALHPPAAAIAMMPMVAIWGMNTSMLAFSLVCGALDVMLAWLLLGQLNLDRSGQRWLTAFFGLGTIVWTETLFASTWTMPEVVRSEECRVGEERRHRWRQ